MASEHPGPVARGAQRDESYLALETIEGIVLYGTLAGAGWRIGENGEACHEVTLQLSTADARIAAAQGPGYRVAIVLPRQTSSS